jgi:hypothetical protein
MTVNSALFDTASSVKQSERHRLPAATVRLVTTGGVVQNFCLTGGYLRNVGLEALPVVAIAANQGGSPMDATKFRRNQPSWPPLLG